MSDGVIFTSLFYDQYFPLQVKTIKGNRYNVRNGGWRWFRGSYHISNMSLFFFFFFVSREKSLFPLEGDSVSFGSVKWVSSFLSPCPLQCRVNFVTVALLPSSSPSPVLRRPRSLVSFPDEVPVGCLERSLSVPFLFDRKTSVREVYRRSPRVPSLGKQS